MHICHEPGVFVCQKIMLNFYDKQKALRANDAYSHEKEIISLKNRKDEVQYFVLMCKNIVLGDRNSF